MMKKDEILYRLIYFLVALILCPIIFFELEKSLPEFINYSAIFMAASILLFLFSAIMPEDALKNKKVF